MTKLFPADCVVLDIEGTTSASAFVFDVLFPYARERLPRLLDDGSADTRIRDAMAQVRSLSKEPAADVERIGEILRQWSDEDRKATPLKTLQGIIWAEGFAKGDFVAHFFDDVVPALRDWRGRGVGIFVYSSGSCTVQRAWFAHSPEGDLTPLIDGLYDTSNGGPKQSQESYRSIADLVGVDPRRILFLSDRAAELDAARSAGWRTLLVRRPGEPYSRERSTDHPETASFEGIIVTTGP